jgi:long-chain acyl-CoA synthetase
MSLNLAVLLTASARKYPTKTALIFDNFKLNYAQLDGVSNQFANGLSRLGVKRGDKVGIMLPNIPQFVIAYYAIVKMGAVVVPMNVLLKADEIEYYLKDSDAVAIVAWEGFLGEAVKGFERLSNCRNLIVVQTPGSQNPLPQAEGVMRFEEVHQNASPKFDVAATSTEDTAVIIYTSGTTGRPKGAELTHFNMMYTAQVGEKLLPPSPDDVGLAVLPLFHIFGQSSVMNAMVGRSGTLTMVARFEPAKVLEVMERDRVTIFAGVPTMFFALLNYPERKKYDTSSLKYAISGGAAIPVEVLRAFEQEFNVPILEGYGLSETCANATFNDLENPRKPGSIGRPIWGIDLKLVDSNDEEVPQGERGEIVLRGHCVMKGYYQRPEATEEAMRNEWFHTGDVGYMDEEGYIFIVDRIKDMIIRGGYNVYPREIEEVLYQHPAVLEAAVIGVPDPKMGEDVKAFVSLKAGASATPEELIEFTKAKVAAYKYPREVEILPELPKNATGKILKRELRNQTQATENKV